MDQVQDILIDIKEAMTIMPMYVKGDLEELKNIIYERYEKISKYLNNKPWLVGELTIVDFVFAEMVNIAMFFTNNELSEKFPNLKEYLERFNNLDSMKKFNENDPTAHFKFNNKICKLNN